MAIYHFHIEIISRTKGRSSVAAAAYRAGEKLYNEREGNWHDFTRKRGVVYKEIMLPENAPREYFNRSVLWNANEKAEKRYDAQTAREFNVALQVEFSLEENIEMLREYLQKNFVDVGMCVDFAIHDNGDGNPHAHVTLTMRHVTEKGFGNKNRDWNKTELLEQWRKNWAEICNDKFKEKGIDERIDHRTLEAQGIDREPTIHVGFSPERRRENEEIIKRNEMAEAEQTAEYMHELKEGYIILDREKSHPAQKEALKREYHQQKLFVKTRPDNAEIQECLKRLEKEWRGRLSPSEFLARRRSENVLDTITKRDFTDILKELSPKQAMAILAHRAREKELEKELEKEIEL